MLNFGASKPRVRGGGPGPRGPPLDPHLVSIVLTHISGFVSRSQEKSDTNQLRSFEGQMLQ